MSWQAVLLGVTLRVCVKARVSGRAFPTARARFARLLLRGSRLVKLPRGVVCSEAVVGGVHAEWVMAKGQQSSPLVLVYFHGGAFIAGSPQTHRDVAWRLSLACRARVLLVDYRLAPAHLCPAPVEDAVSVYQGLLRQGFGSDCVAFIGDSAGANVAVAAIVEFSAMGMALPGACICLSPWVDLSHSSPGLFERAKGEAMLPLDLLQTSARCYAGQRALTEPAVSPLFARFHGFPPLLIYAATEELLVDDARRLAERASADGVSVTLRVCAGQVHAFPTFAAFVPEARRAIEEIGAFVRLNLGGADHTAAAGLTERPQREVNRLEPSWPLKDGVA